MLGVGTMNGGGIVREKSRLRHGAGVEDEVLGEEGDVLVNGDVEGRSVSPAAAAKLRGVSGGLGARRTSLLPVPMSLERREGSVGSRAGRV